MNTTLESSVEARFSLGVKRGLGGKPIKLAPIEAGAPDRIVLLPGGHAAFVELKQEGEKPRGRQVIWHHQVAQLGFPVQVLAGLAEVDAWLHSMSRALGYSGVLPRFCPNRHDNRWTIARSGRRVCPDCPKGTK